jgi:acyl-CoA synthetase (AMP-forming)/AMP-acid ligase II
VLGRADGATPFASLLDGDGEAPRLEVDPARDLVALPYSSGTTGTAKGVAITHRNAVAALVQLDPAALYGPDDRILAVLPFFHSYGMHLLMNEVLRKGATCVTMPRFDLEQYLELVQRYRITRLYVVPPIALALAKHPLVARYDLSSVGGVGCGAAPLDEAVEQAVADRLGRFVAQGYGMTEATVVIAVSEQREGGWKRGSVGRLLPNMEARVVDVTSGDDLGPGERGELLVRGPNVTSGYLNRPEETRDLVDAEGWLHTGDIAYVDGDGFLFIVDRAKELIKYKGYQVAPATLEGVLAAHPAVADAAVIGVPDEEAGEVPKAFVALKAPASPEDILAFAAARLAPYERIRELELVEAVPRSPSGKLLRRLLRDREREARARAWAARLDGGGAHHHA